MEALKLGVPVVAPAVGGLSEVVTTDDNGILAKPGSSIALADAIERALRPETHARVVAGAGRRVLRECPDESAFWCHSFR